MNQQQQQILWWRQLEVEYQQLANNEQNTHRNSMNQSPFGIRSPLNCIERRNPLDLSTQNTGSKISNKIPCPSPHSVTQLPPLRPWNPNMLGMLPTSPYLSDNHGNMNRTPIKPVGVQEPYDSFGFTWIWISKIAAHFALQRQTAHFANMYAQIILQKHAKDWKISGSDAPVSNYNDVVALQKKLQMLATVCVLIAGKIEEEQPVKPVDLVDYLTEHGAVAPTIDSLLESESTICGELQWNLHPTTVMSWLLMLLASDNPHVTLSQFMGKLTNPTGTQDLLVRAVELVDIAFGYQQHADFLPSVIAGSTLLVVDQALDVHYIAQMLQLDIHVLWECRMWLATLSPQDCSGHLGVGMSGRHSLPGVYEGKSIGTRHTERWKKVEEVAFIQSEGKTPRHLAVGLLEPHQVFQTPSNVRRPSYPFSSPPMVYQPQQYYQPPIHQYNKPANESVPYYQERRGSYSGFTLHEKTQNGFTCSCASPCLSSDGAYCRGLCQNNWKDSEGPPVYHFKYGWQNVGTDLHQMPMENMTYHRGY